ncbi:S41 family peptidase [Caulobacter sp. NIBR1757]|uniref:S41 family peptidase n=1 Tax=Caulobacter sp. NIBR1757 TaxID=3016000 RepID=UPI0022EFDF9F|nr:S41 family peptidase [Caulobacter sp. NIBR1757]WGM39816.1 hypothetical protein AMEJIAPC_02744 [Caulobacter sp. NIBR1757]
MRRRLLIIAAAALALLAPAVGAQDRAFDPEPLLSQAISGVQQRAFRADKVDWPALEARVRAMAAGARDELDLLPAYAVLLNGLGDSHSFVQVPRERQTAFFARYGRTFDAVAGLSRGGSIPPSSFAGRQTREARSLPLANGAEALLMVVPSFSGYPPEAQAFADGLFQTLADGARTACGYVIDLRGNGGGNMWPMVTGLSPLLGNGMALGKQDSSGPPYVYANLRDGAAVIAQGGGAPNRLQAVQGWRDLRLTGAPVAILQDGGVASSGEAVLAAFIGRPATRTFGERSFGLASTNAGYRLADGANLVITVGMMTDREGRTYPAGFTPDEPIPAGPGLAADPDDAVVEAAKLWLVRQPACRKG